MKIYMSRRARLACSVGGIAIMAAMPVSALAQVTDEVNATQTTYAVANNQLVNSLDDTPTNDDRLTISPNVAGAIVTEKGDLLNSSVSVGNVGNVANPNTYSAIAAGNEAALTLNSAINISAIGTSAADLAADTFKNAPTDRDRARATSANTSLAITSAQTTEQTAATPSLNTSIGVLSGSVTSSTVTVAGNKQTSAGTLNSSTLAINATSNGADDSSGITSSQVVTNSSLTSTTASLAGILATAVTGTDNAQDATLALTNNVQSAEGTGNYGKNTLNASGNDQLVQTAANGGATAIWDKGSTADATNAIASNQLVQTGTALTAAVTGSAAEGTEAFVVALGGTATDSTVRNETNSASASISGNDVANAINLSGNSLATAVTGGTNGVGTAAALGSNQAFYGDATASALAGTAGNGLPVLTAIDGAVATSSVSTSSNTIAANASGNTGSNSVSATNNTINTGVATTASASGFGGTLLDGAAASAGLALASAQDASDGSIVATLTTFSTPEDGLPVPVSGAAVATTVGGNVSASTVKSNANALLAAATANSVANSVGATGTNVTTSSALANNQWTSSDVRAIVVPVSLGTPAIAAVPGTTFNGTASVAYTGTVNLSGLSADEIAAFKLANPGSGTDAAWVLDTWSTTGPISLELNVADFFLDGSWVENTFTSEGTYDPIQQALISAEYPAGSWSPAGVFTYTSPFPVPDSSATLPIDGYVKPVTGEGTAKATVTGLTTAQADALAAANTGWTRTGDTFTFAYTGTETLAYSGETGGAPEVPGIPGAPFAAGVTVAIGGDITGSSVTVDGNEARGSVDGNVATNRIAVSATNLSGTELTTSDGNLTLGTAPAQLTVAGQATADHSLANVQVLAADEADLTGTTLSTLVGATYGIQADQEATADPVTVITNSRLSVSDNEQSATTRGNVASNSVSLSATNMDAGGAISSYQTNGYVDPAAPTTPYNSAVVGSRSLMTVSAPAAMTSSSLALDNNSNEAVATVNTAANAMTVSATNATSISSGANVDLESSVTTTNLGLAAKGDFIVNNLQASDEATWGEGEPVTGQGPSATVSAQARTLVTNQGTGLTITDASNPALFVDAGLTSSSVSMQGNATIAQGTANDAANSLALNGGSSLATTGGVVNTQLNRAGVMAEAEAIVALGLAADSVPASVGEAQIPAKAVVDQSTVTVSSNTTNALARGNTASNALTVSALQLTANSGTEPAQATVGLNTGNVADLGVSASYGVLNNQLNTGTIAATAAFTYGVGLEDSDTTSVGTVLNASAVTVNGNSTRATGVGNVASNALTLTALNQGSATAVMANEQINTGNISATVNFAFGGMTAGQNPASNVNGSSVSVGGNSASAVAVGNSVTGVFTRN